MREFEWDEKKAEANLRIHKVPFEDAKIVFDDPYCITEEDDRFETGEVRWQTIGMSNKLLLLLVAHTTQENGIEVIRIISARKAKSKERKRYGNRKIPRG